MILRVVAALVLVHTFTQLKLVANASNGQAITSYPGSGYEASQAREDGNKSEQSCSFCPAYLGEWFQLKCTRENVQLSIGYCITIQNERESRLFATKCPYYQLKGHNVSEPGYIKLPDNISELNDYMCGPMNRKGFLCEDCIDGFAVSFTSMGHKCSNCTDAWYGVPLYLLVELAPITVFYLIVLIFQVHITSAPMTCFIFCCQSIQVLLFIDRYTPVERIIPQLENNILFNINVFFYGIWNLDFLRYIAPAFCISGSFKLIHTTLLGYVSVFYPLCLIALTWICIKLHDDNFQPIAWLWRPFHSCFVKIRRGYSSRNDVIDVFTAFFLLSYTKLMFQIAFLLACSKIRNHTDYYLVMEYDTTINCSSSRYYQFAVPALFSLCIFNILPALLLVFYPIGVFRKCLFKCKLDSLSLAAFTEKFYCCYRDGLDGGRDMRSFAGFYFLLRYLPFLFYALGMQHTFFTLWSYLVLIYLSSSLLIALVRPYKATYMNVLDTLMLGFAAFTCAVLSQQYSVHQKILFFTILCIPTFAFGLNILLLSILLRLCKWLSSLIKAKILGRNYSFNKPDDQLQPLLADIHN